jgi:hypothetical protein
MKKWQLLCSGLLVLSLTSCGDNTASTSPTVKPTTVPESSVSATPSSESSAAPDNSTSSPLVPASSPTAAAKSEKSPAATKESPASPEVSAATDTSLDDDAASASVSKASLATLQGVIDSTKTAIEAGKLDEAKTEFAKFSDSWQAVEDGVKSKSADTYKSIADGVKSVNDGIGSKQAKATLIASLQKLSQSIEAAGN